MSTISLSLFCLHSFFCFDHCQNAIQNIITTFAGVEGPGGNYGSSGGDNGPAAIAQLNGPYGLSPDISGNVYIAESYSNKIRKVLSTGIIITIAGTGYGAPFGGGSSGDNGPATFAQLNGPVGVSADISGNVYIAEIRNRKIRKVFSAGTIITFAGGGIGDGDNDPATSAQLNGPFALSVDVSGNLYIADTSKIRMVSSNGIITTLAGTWNYPEGITADIHGNVYISDSGNNMIRMVSKLGIVSTIAGTGMAGSIGDGNSATSAELDYPQGLGVDSNGNVYFVDYNNNKIRKISSSGIITTYAGKGIYRDGDIWDSSDGGVATAAQLITPHGLGVDTSGRVYISEQENSRVRLVYPLQPSASPTLVQPSRMPIARLRQVSPTGQPTGRPSSFNKNPSARYPTGQPSRSPSRQPSRQPTSRPTTLVQNVTQPTGQPSAKPSKRTFVLTPATAPSSQPSSQPSKHGTSFRPNPNALYPTGQPSRQPSMQPTQQSTTLYQKVMTYQYTGAVQTYTVPVGVMLIEISAAGAAGGGGYNSNVWSVGGRGGYIKTLLSVSPGQVYYVYVGGMGASRTSGYYISHSSGGYNGGGPCTDPNTGEGGGGTDVRTSANDVTTRVVVSGGGE